MSRFGGFEEGIPLVEDEAPSAAPQPPPTTAVPDASLTMSMSAVADDPQQLCAFNFTFNFTPHLFHATFHAVRLSVGGVHFQSRMSERESFAKTVWLTDRYIYLSCLYFTDVFSGLGGVFS